MHYVPRVMISGVLRALCASLLLSTAAGAATLEKMTVEEMSQKATLIVRGRVGGCAGEARGPVIYTSCTLSVTERWKGTARPTIRFVIPGGRANGLTQTFTGTPKFTGGNEYVLFLWSGRSAVNQLIGLSQGVFNLQPQVAGEAKARREKSAARMVDSEGNDVADEAVEVRVTELRQRVRNALLSGDQQ